MPTLVLLHGFTHTGASWDAVVAALGERYRAIAPDLRGHGSASARQPVDLDGVIADLESLVSGEFTLAGYSMGGRLALHVALALGDRVQRLILIGASPGIADARERAARRAADDRLAGEIERVTIEEFANRWATNPVLAGQPARIRESVHADRLRSTPSGLARALRSLGAGVMTPLWDRLGTLGCPVTLIVGERDAKFVEIATQMVSAIPDAQLAIVAGAGHAVHLEAPARVAALIAERG